MDKNTIRFAIFLVLVFALGLDIGLKRQERNREVIEDDWETWEDAEGDWDERGVAEAIEMDWEEAVEAVETVEEDWIVEEAVEAIEDETVTVYNSEEIFLTADQMPRFPGCEDMMTTNAVKSKCADGKLLEFIYKNLKYPSLARVEVIEGTVIIQFIVGKDGRINSPKILRDIGGGCGEEALRVVESMNDMSEKWTPGLQQNTPVKVQFTIPIRFKLEN